VTFSCCKPFDSRLTAKSQKAVNRPLWTDEWRSLPVWCWRWTVESRLHCPARRRHLTQRTANTTPTHAIRWEHSPDSPTPITIIVIKRTLSYSENSISAIQNLDYPIWKSSISISTKVKLPVWFWALGSYQKRCIQDWCPRPLVFAKAVRNQMLPPCVMCGMRWDGQPSNYRSRLLSKRGVSLCLATCVRLSCILSFLVHVKLSHDTIRYDTIR